MIAEVPRNDMKEQARIAQLAVQHKVRLVWNDKRRVIQVLAVKSSVCAQRAGFKEMNK